MAAVTVASPVPAPSDSESLWMAALNLPCDLRIELPAPGFTVRDLLQLAPDSVVATNCKQGHNIPLTVNDQLLAWTEFEVLGDKMAIRLMEIV